jgi:hypothetical protein
MNQPMPQWRLWMQAPISSLIYIPAEEREERNMGKKKANETQRIETGLCDEEKKAAR